MGQIGQYTVSKSVGLGSLIYVITASWGYLKKKINMKAQKFQVFQKKINQRTVKFLKRISKAWQFFRHFLLWLCHKKKLRIMIIYDNWVYSGFLITMVIYQSQIFWFLWTWWVSTLKPILVPNWGLVHFLIPTQLWFKTGQQEGNSLFCNSLLQKIRAEKYISIQGREWRGETQKKAINFGGKLSFILSFLYPERRLHCCYIYFHCSYLYSYCN